MAQKESVDWKLCLSYLFFLPPQYLQSPRIWYAVHDVNGFLTHSDSSDEMESDCPLSVVYILSAYTSMDKGESNILSLA